MSSLVSLRPAGGELSELTTTTDFRIVSRKLDLDMSGDISMSAPAVYVYSNENISGDLSVGGNTNIEGDLSVAGTVTAGAIEFTGADLTGNLSVGGALNVV